MDSNIEEILNNLNDELSSDTYFYLRNYLANKTRQEKIELVVSWKRPNLIEYLISNSEDMLECYAKIQRLTLTNHNDKIYELLMELQDETLIIKYFNSLSLGYLKRNLVDLIRSDKLKMDYIKNSLDDENKYLMACSLQDDKSKIQSLEYIRDIRFKSFIIRSIHDETLRAQALMTVIPHFRMSICETITSQKILRELYAKNIDCGFSHKLLCLIHDDEFKKIAMLRYNLVLQIDVINSFDDERNIHEIIWDNKYDNYCEGLVGRLTDEEFIIKYFNKSDNLNFKIKIINTIKSNELKKKLIYLLGEIDYQNILLGNVTNDKEVILRERGIPNVKYDIDPRISIGVELEACCNYPELYLTIKKLLCNWDIKLDRTIVSGVEITSPVLHYNSVDLKELKFVCDFLSRNNFYTDGSCGGHLHFGFDYFETLDEFKVFLMLYQNVENILYLISNRPCSMIRDGVDKYAKRLSPVLKKIAKVNVSFEKIADLTEYVTLIKNTCNSRYYGLNLYNVFEQKHTIEFRMPNGEIEFDELILNIRLFAKMMEMSKKITKIINKINLNALENSQLKLYRQIINDEFNNYDKLQSLLSLLFPETEHQVYLNRYTANRKINKQKTR